jgi:lipopolysaccharide/colanic/teichoic acid biosynthesis glycosyltransferase
MQFLKDEVSPDKMAVFTSEQTSVLRREPMNLQSRIHRFRSREFYGLGKKIFDTVISLALILLLAPLFLAVALLIRMTSPGPAFFRQFRVGKDGQIFLIMKFRTMYVHTPSYHVSPASPLDERITRVGRFLRRTSLDELPQLINVLRGEMSLVGPRPEMPFIVARYNDLQRERLRVRPGITGLWQISADRTRPIHENMTYDLYYIQNRSLLLDAAILIRTVLFAVFAVKNC